MTLKPTIKRLTPKPDTLRALYLLSGNLCAHPKCTKVLITKRGIMIGEVCHIESAEVGGPRFNPSMTNEQRRDQSNLMLLCSIHHTLIDRDTKRYSVADLKKMKAAHESKFSEIADTLKQRFESQIKDHTDDTQPTVPVTLNKIRKHFGYDFTKSEMKSGLKAISDYARRLANLPDEDRTFMLAIIRRSLKLHPKYGTISLDVFDVERALKLGRDSLKNYAHVLEQHSLGGIVERGDKEWRVEIDDPWDYITWTDIAGYADLKGFALEDVVLGAKFHYLD